MIQELVFTTLPHQRMEQDGKQYLKLSVFVSPHLKNATETVLANAPDMYNWAERILDTQFSFRIDGLKSAIKAEMDKSAIDKELFRSIFHANIQIEKFETEKLHLKPVQSFPVTHIRDFLLDQVKKIAIESPTQLIPASHFVDPDRLGVISDIKIDDNVLNTDNVEARSKTTQTKTFVLKKNLEISSMQQVLRNNRFIPFKKQADPATDFLQLKDFHRKDNKISQKLIIRKPQFEFHNILSVLNSYPVLMRRLGFILDFVIPYQPAYPASGTIQVIPEGIRFEEVNTKISVPKTAYSITLNGFYASDKSGSVLRKGFVKINTDDFAVVQMDTDGMALKTAQTVDEKTIQAADFLSRKALAIRKSDAMLQNLRLSPQISSVGKTGNNMSKVKSLKTNEMTQADPQPKNQVRPVLSFQKMKPVEKMKLVEVPSREGFHAMRTAGIALIRNGMSQHVAEKLQRNSGFQKMLVDNAEVDLAMKNLLLPEEILYSDDLVMAYRMDIAYEDNPGKWHSLHQRRMSYSWFDEAGTAHPIDGIEPDEGYVEMGIIEKENDQDNIYVPETLARWEGWSLSVGKPGMAINDSEDHPAKKPTDRHDYLSSSREVERKKYLFDPTLDFKLNAQAEPVNGTLPRLRFGKSYRIRIRTVDMAGNSLPLDTESESPSDTYCTNIRYYRYEPLSSPLVLVGNELRDGEFLEQMVIRSNYDADVADYEKKYTPHGQDSKGRSVRYLLPPKNSQLMAETHGKFEKAFADPQKAKEIYSIITSHEGLYERNADNSEKIYTDQEAKIIYLPDPMAAGIAVFVDTESDDTHDVDFLPRMFSFFSKDELSADKTNAVSIPDDWYNTEAIRIKLEEGASGASWDGSKRTFTVKLPKGQRIRLRISTFWREEDMKKLSAIWQLVKSDAGARLAEIENIARSGQHWMISPSRTFELVHAVQQPVEEPSLMQIVPERDYNDTLAMLNVRFSVHGESTGMAELKASWTEPLDDGISVEIKEKNFTDTIPEIDIYYHDQTVTLGTVNETRPGLPDRKLELNQPKWKTEPLTIRQFDVQPGSLKINNFYKLKAEKLADIHRQKTTDNSKNVLATLRLDLEESKLSLVKMLDLRHYPLEHAFGNTRHRWVNYSVVAISRYAEYFTNVKKNKPEISFVRESKTGKINILSTAKPDKPEIDYIIPAFEWQKTSQGGMQTHIRKGGVLRVYLKRPWFSSGEEEKLAVILPDNSGNTSPMITTMIQGVNYTDAYTHWGADPLFVSELPVKASPQPADFRLNPVVEKGLTYPGNETAKATAVAYPVTFDKEKQLWYADIALDTANMYFPFIRLALARYQQHSLRIENTDVCLSNVVMAGMIQMVPERKTSVVLNTAGKDTLLSFRIAGPTYNHRSSRFGIREIIKVTVMKTKTESKSSTVLIENQDSEKRNPDSWTFEVGRNMKNDYTFDINENIRLPEAYRTGSFQVVVEEIELGPQNLNNLPDAYKERLEHPEETNRVVFADVFTIVK